MTLWRRPRGLALMNARVVGPAGVIARSLRVAGGRVAGVGGRPMAGDVVVDLEGAFIYPGLINAHDHLELDNFPRLKWRERYDNVREWAAGFQPRFKTDPALIEAMAPALADRLLIGGLKNVLAGVTTVAHHNPLHAPLRRGDYPVRVVRHYGWSHSLLLDGDEAVAKACRRTPPGWPWIIHAAEGTDVEAAGELGRLDALGCLRANTVLVHGVGLTAAGRARLLETGGGLVWCPASNEFMLGATVKLGELRQAGRVALASNSRLSGSRDLLDELRCAAATGQASPAELFRMVTTDAAALLRLTSAGRQLWARRPALSGAPGAAGRRLAPACAPGAVARPVRDLAVGQPAGRTPGDGWREAGRLRCGAAAGMGRCADGGAAGDAGWARELAGKILRRPTATLGLRRAGPGAAGARGRMTAATAPMAHRLAGWRLDLAWVLPPAAAHGLGLALYINWADFAANPPFHFTDYATHYAAAEAVSHFLAGGHLWGYSPFFLAGFAEGTLVDLDNKGVELASYGLMRAGVPLPHAFNWVMLALLAAAPFAIYGAARLLGRPPASAGVAQWLMLAVWYSDGAVRWMWQGSILAFAAAALGGLLVAAAFWRWGAGIAYGARGRWAIGLTWFGLGPLLFWAHAEAFAVLAVAMGAGTLLFGRRWSPRGWLVLAGWAALVIAANWAWLAPDLRLLDTLGSTYDLQGGFDRLRQDIAAPYALLRLALLAAAALGLAGWRRSGAPWWRPAAVCLATWLVIVYGGAYLGLGALEPYRLILPALGLACLPAADWLVGAWRRSPRWGALGLLAVALAAAPPLYAARPQGLRQHDGTPADSLSGPQPGEQAVCRALAQLDLSAGRVLTDDWRLGAWLPACSGAQVIGGPSYLVWTQFNHANADQVSVAGQLVATMSPADLAAVLRQYNVHWVIVNTAFADWVNLADWDRQHPGLFAPAAQHGPFAILPVAEPSGWFIQGGHAAGGLQPHHHSRRVVRRRHHQIPLAAFAAHRAAAAHPAGGPGRRPHRLYCRGQWPHRRFRHRPVLRLGARRAGRPGPVWRCWARGWCCSLWPLPVNPAMGSPPITRRRGCCARASR